MNLQEFIEKVATLGYLREDAESLACVVEDMASLRLQSFNLVPRGGDQYEIFRSDERDSFYNVLDSQGDVFVGTLEESYDFIFATLQKHFEIYKGWTSN